MLDPSDIVGIGFPEPFGVSVVSLIACIRAVLQRWPLAGAGITEFAPTSPADAVEDMPTILRIVAALAKSA